MEDETNHGEYEQYLSMGTRVKAERIALGTHVQFGCCRHRDNISTGGSLEGKRGQKTSNVNIVVGRGLYLLNYLINETLAYAFSLMLSLDHNDVNIPRV